MAKTKARPKVRIKKFAGIAVWAVAGLCLTNMLADDEGKCLLVISLMCCEHSKS